MDRLKSVLGTGGNVKEPRAVVAKREQIEDEDEDFKERFNEDTVLDLEKLKNLRRLRTEWQDLRLKLASHTSQTEAAEKSETTKLLKEKKNKYYEYRAEVRDEQKPNFLVKKIRDLNKSK